MAAAALDQAAATRGLLAATVFLRQLLRLAEAVAAVLFTQEHLEDLVAAEDGAAMPVVPGTHLPQLRRRETAAATEKPMGLVEVVVLEVLALMA